MSKTLKAINIIRGIKEIDPKSKDGYCWLISNWDCVPGLIKKLSPSHSLGDVRKALYNEIGFAPAILFSFSHLLLGDPVEYASMISNQLKR